MNRTILLQTDFSLTWGAVASMKGVIRTVAPEAVTEDLCHDIRKFDPWEASLSLKAVLPYWPGNTIVVSVVDPGVGTERKASSALLTDGKIVITPDNGTLTHLKNEGLIREIREIYEDIVFPSSDVSVFHGRDIFAYAAALIACGKKTYEEIGREYPVSSIAECTEYHTHPVIGERAIDCFIMTGNVHFGGIEFNVRNDEWDGFSPEMHETFILTISHSGETVFTGSVPYEKSFGYVEEGAPVLYRGSSGYLSLDLNQGHLMNRYGIGTGLGWTAHIERK